MTVEFARRGLSFQNCDTGVVTPPPAPELSPYDPRNPPLTVRSDDSSLAK
jgi:hypothetical protein